MENSKFIMKKVNLENKTLIDAILNLNLQYKYYVTLFHCCYATFYRKECTILTLTHLGHVYMNYIVPELAN
jgi:hypothetical protein